RRDPNTSSVWRRILWKRTNFGIPNEINAVRFPYRRDPAPLGTPLCAPTLPQRQATGAKLVAAPLGHGRAYGHPDNRALVHPDRGGRDKPGDDAASFAPVASQA